MGVDSRKETILKLAVWSNWFPPSPDRLAELQQDVRQAAAKRNLGSPPASLSQVPQIQAASSLKTKNATHHHRIESRCMPLLSTSSSTLLSNSMSCWTGIQTLAFRHHQ